MSTQKKLDLAALEREADAAVREDPLSKYRRRKEIKFTMRTGEWLKRNFSKDELSSLNDYLLALEKDDTQKIEKTVKAWEKQGDKGEEMMALAAGMRKSSKGNWYYTRLERKSSIKPKKVGKVKIVQQEYVFAGVDFRVTGPKNIITANIFNHPQVSIERKTSPALGKGNWLDVTESQRPKIAKALMDKKHAEKKGGMKTISG